MDRGVFGGVPESEGRAAHHRDSRITRYADNMRENLLRSLEWQLVEIEANHTSGETEKP
jgi:hypothetical protein